MQDDMNPDDAGQTEGTNPEPPAASPQEPQKPQSRKAVWLAMGAVALALGLIVVGKLMAFVALKISALNSNRARPGSWNAFARRKSISPNQRPRKYNSGVLQSPV